MQENSAFSLIADDGNSFVVISNTHHVMLVLYSIEQFYNETRNKMLSFSGFE